MRRRKNNGSPTKTVMIAGMGYATIRRLSRYILRAEGDQFGGWYLNFSIEDGRVVGDLMTVNLAIDDRDRRVIRGLQTALKA